MALPAGNPAESSIFASFSKAVLLKP